MSDERPVLAPDDVRDEARGLLLAIDASRGRGAFETGWKNLWQLVREAKAAQVLSAETAGPWHLSSGSTQAQIGLPRRLAAGVFSLPLWPSDEPRYANDLPGFLNWAGVLIPDWRR